MGLVKEPWALSYIAIRVYMDHVLPAPIWWGGGGVGGGRLGQLALQTSPKTEWGLVTPVVLYFAFMLRLLAEDTKPEGKGRPALRGAQLPATPPPLFLEPLLLLPLPHPPNDGC